MKEKLKNTVQMMVMSIWRRKRIMASCAIILLVIFLYLLFTTVNKDTGYSSSGISVKHPIDIEFASEILVNPPTEQPEQQSEKKSVREKFSDNGIKPTSIQVKPKSSAFPPKTSNVSSFVTEEAVYIPPLRLVHLDLKGAPPKKTYFESIFPLLKSAGANGILLQYEDTFPFWGELAPIAAQNAYSRKDITYILELAKNHDMIVIPLIQTFGHLEFVKKLFDFMIVRKVEAIPQILCPLDYDARPIVEMMIDQIMAFHSDSRWLHIGCDEVYQLGQCLKCVNCDENSIFLTYVRNVAKYVKEKHNVTPIIWDDMLRPISKAKINKYSIGSLVEPMARTYVEDVYRSLPSSLWEKYSKIFPYMWTASAFKGAFDSAITVPDANRYLKNNIKWLMVMSEKKDAWSSGFRGIAITGKQRCDHFAPLCELLPAALPSLILNLLTVSQGQFTKRVFPKMQELLECSSRAHYRLDFDHDPYMWRALGVCFFPGSAVFRITLRLNEVTKWLDTFKVWVTEYNFNHNFSIPARVNELLNNYSYYNSSLNILQEAAVEALREVYDDDTASEWIYLNIYPYVKEMKRIWELVQRLKEL